MIVASAAFLWFLDPHRDRKHSDRPNMYTEHIFENNQLADLPFPIVPNDVHLNEDQLQININLFSFFDDDGIAGHPLFISKKLYPRTANLLNWEEHYAPITDIPRLFQDINKHEHCNNICIRCLGSFYTEEYLWKHQRLCTREDFMSVVHVLPAPETEQSHIKFNHTIRNTYRSSFVIFADFESILGPMKHRVKQTLYNQQQKIFAACAILVSNVPAVPTQTWESIWENALSENLNTLIDWERVCIDHLTSNVPMNRLSRAKQEEFDYTTHCHICRKPFEGDQDPRGLKVRDHDQVTGWFIAAAHKQCNLQRSVNYQIPVFFHNFRRYDSHMIVHEFPNIQDRKLKVIGQNMETYLQV